MCLTRRFVATYKYGNDNPCVAVKGMKKKYFDRNTIRRVFGYLNEYEGAYKAIAGMVAQRAKNAIFQYTMRIRSNTLYCEFINKKGLRKVGGAYRRYKKIAIKGANERNLNGAQRKEYVDMKAFVLLMDKIRKFEGKKVKKVALISKLRKHNKYDFVGRGWGRKGGKEMKYYGWILTHKVRDLPRPIYDWGFAR